MHALDSDRDVVTRALIEPGSLHLQELFSRGRQTIPSRGPLAALTMAGALDIIRVLTGATELLEFDPQGIAIAKVISAGISSIPATA